MLKLDLLIAIIFMSLLFLRHISVYKERNKINYTPIVLGIGIIAGLFHFVVLGDDLQWLLVLRESLLSVIVGIVLSAIMSVMSQTQNASNENQESVRIEEIVVEMDELKRLFESFSFSLNRVAQMENTTHEQLKSIFKEEIEALGSILKNQKFFVQKVESVLAQQQVAQEKFEEFTLSELPSLDNIVHRHIDLLRISEQDHFNQLKSAIKASSEEKMTVNNEFIAIKNALEKLQKSYTLDGVAQTLEREMVRILSDFAHGLHTASLKSEGMMSALREHETILQGSREQSEMIMQQLVLSSNQMREISHSAKDLGDAMRPLGLMLGTAQSLLKEFIVAKSKISELLITLEAHEKYEYREVREHLESVANAAIVQMEMFVNAVAQHEGAHHTTPNEVLELSHKAKLYQSYNSDKLMDIKPIV